MFISRLLRLNRKKHASLLITATADSRKRSRGRPCCIIRIAFADESKYVAPDLNNRRKANNRLDMI